MGGILILQFRYQIHDERGIHVRAAGLLAKLAKEAKDTNITVTKGDTTIRVSQTMKLLALGVKQGDEIGFTVDGPNEKKVIITLHQLLKSNL